MPFNMTPCKFVVLTFFFSILFSCNQTHNHTDRTTKIDTVKKGTSISSDTSSQKKHDTDYQVDIENKIIDTIFSLTEVKKRAKYIEEETKGERHMKVWVAESPNFPAQKYYWIKVGEDNGMNLVTHFNFYVFPDSMKIMYYDSISDSIMTIKEWRKLNNGM